MADVLYKVELPHDRFGMLVRDGIVVSVATSMYWAKSKAVDEVLAWVEKQKGTWRIVSEGPTTPREEFVEAYVSCSPSTRPEKAREVYDALQDEGTGVRRRLSQVLKAVKDDKKNT
jgi:hypothetical protein